MSGEVAWGEVVFGVAVLWIMARLLAPLVWALAAVASAAAFAVVSVFALVAGLYRLAVALAAWAAPRPKDRAPELPPLPEPQPVPSRNWTPRVVEGGRR